MDPNRQAFELALLDAAAEADRPVLGVCLGMQLMALRAGGRLDQYLPENLTTAAAHANDRRHEVVAIQEPAPDWWVKNQPVVSAHQQAVADPGTLRRVATSDDGVLEAVDDPARSFWVGVQWHPERGGEGPLNAGLFRALVLAARATR